MRRFLIFTKAMFLIHLRNREVLFWNFAFPVFLMLIYGLIAWVIDRVVWLIFYRPRGPVVGVTETTTSEHHSTP